MFDFPSSPSVGQLYPSPAVAGKPVYKFDGAKWKTSSAPSSGLPATTPPSMDGTVSPGVLNEYSRGDHRHPTDTRYVSNASPAFTGTLTATTFNTTFDFTLGGKIAAAGTKGHKFGYASGAAWDGAITRNDTNIVLYDYDGLNNWCGIGTDPNGFFYVRVTGGVAMISDTAKVGFTGTAWAPSPANGTNNTQWATTAFVQANQPVGGPYLPLTGGTISGTLTVSYGHIMPYRNGATGVLYLGSGATDRYLYYDGTNYSFAAGILNTAAGRIWGTGDWTRPVSSARIGGHAGDFAHTTTNAEPYAGAVLTGSTGTAPWPGGLQAWTGRYRFNQIYVEGTWYTAGYV